MPTTIARVLLLAGGALLWGTAAFPQAPPLFTQRERQAQAPARSNSRCKPEPYDKTITFSEITVLESREVEYRISTLTPCLGEVGNPPFALRWDAPHSGKATVSHYTLPATDFEQFKIFLDREDVRDIHDFMNAGPGVGDFKIAITRAAGPQNIEVVSLSPNHIELVARPALIHLVCQAKEMARRASRSGELPDWCRNARPLKPVR
jgi:hypothetical protein